MRAMAIGALLHISVQSLKRVGRWTLACLVGYGVRDVNIISIYPKCLVAGGVSRGNRPDSAGIRYEKCKDRKL